MTIEKITAYAKKQGYAGAEYLGQWRGYDVYDVQDSTFDDSEAVDVGYPLRILVKGSSIRMTTDDESLELLDALPEEDEDTDEIEEV